MYVETSHVIGAVLIGIGATAITDLWALFLKHAFSVPSLSFCLVGRWLLHMPGGTFVHTRIAAAPRKQGECVTGWVAHYVIGILFSFAFILAVSAEWLARPSLLPALVFGVVTVLFPYLLMQPALGLGFAASRAPSPARARLKSLVTHTVFGIGLYVSGIGLNQFV